jgi:ABC-2 type transport system permease protein
VARVLIRLKLASLRHGFRGGQSSLLWAGWTIGAALALATLGVGLGGWSDAPTALDQLALAFLLWAGLWIVVPLVGATSDPLRTEYFALLPVRPGRLVLGLLAASLVGILPTVTLAAFIALVVVGAAIGPGVAVIALAATILLVGLVVAGSKVVAGLVSRAVESRIGIEIAAFQYALLVASTWIWIPLAAVASGAGPSSGGGPLPDAAPALARAVPTGWGIVAVEAAGGGNWPLASAALGGMTVLVGELILAWSQILSRQLQGERAGAVISRPAGRGTGRLVDALPATPVGATTAKELREWTRQPRRRIQLRVALWTAVLLAVIPGLLGATWLWPFAGIIVAWAAGITAANIYGFDATAIWLTLAVPGSEPVDVRGRQAAWLLAFGTTASAATVVLTLASGQAWAWPWVAAALPAAIGAAVGLVPIVSLALPAPLPDRRAGDPMDLGDDPRTQGALFSQGIVMTILVPLLASPAIFVAYAGRTLNPTFAWLGLPVGIITGMAYGRWLGALAGRRLARRGPELLERMRARPMTEPARARGVGGVPGRAWAAVLVGSVLIFPQGLVPLALVLTNSASRLWFIPRYLPEPWPIPAIGAFILAGLAAYVLAWRWRRGAVM